MRGFLLILVFLISNPILSNAQCQSYDQWLDIIQKINLTPEQAYIIIDKYKGDMDIIPQNIYAMAKIYLSSNNKDVNEKMIFKSSLIEEITKNNEKAILDISKAIKINPNESKYFYTRGRIYLNNGDTEKAMSDLKRSMELNPKNPYVYYELYNLYKNTPEIEKAAENLSKFIKLAPSNDFKRAAQDAACLDMVFNKNKTIEGCFTKADYEKLGIDLKVKKEVTKEDKPISKECCEYECETYATQCCEEYECTDYDYYTSECTNWKCKNWIKCTKEKCKCTKICE
jgi:tetratricopeptide (TPR) repeat protein